MNMFKWLQLISNLLLLLLPAAIEYRNWKHHDKRTNRFKWITGGIIVCWLGCATIFAMMAYQELSKIAPKPNFVFFIENFPVTNGSYLTIPITNDFKSLRFTVGNFGNSVAEGFQFSVSIPAPLNVTNFGNWIQGGGGRWGKNGEFVANDDKVFRAPVDISSDLVPTNLATFPPLIVQWTNLPRSDNSITLLASAKNAPLCSIHTTLCFRNGIGPIKPGRDN